MMKCISSVLESMPTSCHLLPRDGCVCVLQSIISVLNVEEVLKILMKILYDAAMPVYTFKLNLVFSIKHEYSVIC